MAGIEAGIFQNLQPCRYVCFHFPNPLKPLKSCNEIDNDTDLRLAVLDSSYTHPPVRIAAMLVPRGMEDDWIFCTEAGHFQLLSSAQVSRLILIARCPSYSRDLFGTQKYRGEEDEDNTQLKQSLISLLLALSPRIAFQGGLPSVPFVSYADNVNRRNILEKFSSPLVGMMLVENVELLVEETEEIVHRQHRVTTEWRRRLRFQRMPNLVQTEVALVPKRRSKKHGKTSGNGQAKLAVDLNRLVHPYLPPIVAGLVLVAPTIEKCLEYGKLPRLLSIGVGGGALLMFLNRHFRFSLVGVEMDEVVLNVAKKYFGLQEDEHLQIHVGDGVEVVDKIAKQVIRSHLVPAELAQAWQDALFRIPILKELEGDRERDLGVKGLFFSSPVMVNLDHGLAKDVERHGSLKSKEDYIDPCIDKGIKEFSSQNPKDSNLDQGLIHGIHCRNTSKLKTFIGEYDIDKVVEVPGSPSSHLLLTNSEEISEASDPRSSISHEEITLQLNHGAQTESFTVEYREGSDNVDRTDPRVHVIVVDVDAGDARLGLSAPPLQFLEKRFLLAARIALHDHGILAINVLPSSKCFYNELVSAFHEVFLDLYEIEVNNGENYVLLACPFCIGSDGRDSAFADKVKQVITGGYVEKIRKL